MTPIIFTIAARNYTGYVRTLAASVRSAYPTAPFVFFLADTEGNEALELGIDGAQVVPCARLDLPDLRRMAFAYTVTEFSTAIKPSCFLWLLARYPGRPVIYLDPDIMVFRPLEPVEQAFRDGAEMVLTPHAIRPDERTLPPDALTILRGGTCNLGFLAVQDAPEVHGLMRWWERRLHRDCRASLHEGLFVDQKWMEFAPCFVSRCHVARNPGLNVAYWNLGERRLEGGDGSGGGVTVDGEPLYFFHFSGFQPGDGGYRFCKYHDAFEQDQPPALRQLATLYAARLAATADDDAPPYGFGQFADGSPIYEGDRLYFQHRAWDQHSDPFALSRAFFDAPAPEMPGTPAIPRLLYGIHLKWPELQARFNLASEDGRRGLWRWFLDYGQRQEKTGTLAQAAPDLSEPAPPVIDTSVADAIRAETERRLTELEAAVQERDQRLAAITGSLSWRVTVPLRLLRRCLAMLRRR